LQALLSGHGNWREGIHNCQSSIMKGMIPMM